MSEKKLLRTIGKIKGGFIIEADPLSARPGQRMKRARRAALIAAALVLALTGTVLFGGRGTDLLIPAAQAAYEPDLNRLYDGEDLDEHYLEGIRAFAARAGGVLLDGEKTAAYSPAALYTALSMTAEMAEGEYLAAIVRALGAENAEELRENCGILWRYLCLNPAVREPGKVTLANSLWLNKDYAYRAETLESLANNYYISSFIGDMKNEIPRLAKGWVEKQTNGLLSADLKPNDKTIAALYSAIYFYDDWAEKFWNSQVENGRFHTADEQSVPCNFMKREENGRAYFRGEGVTASVQYFANGGKMLFILPDEGMGVQSVLNNEKLLTALFHWEMLAKPEDTVDWWIPRFTLSAKLDLREGLTALGLGPLFSPWQNALSRLCVNMPAYIESAEQATAISINENGCEAASYVQIMIDRSAGALAIAEHVEMHLDRPFVFAILSDNDVPLFLGAVNDPNG